jgi:transcription termination/antitermination protein NusG
MAMRWYVVHAYSGFEKRVQSALLERIERLGMQDQFGDVLVPTEEVVEVRDGKKRKSQRRFYPGYVLVQPAPITQKEADAILRRVQEGVDRPTHKTIYEPGEVVRVVEGPFADFNGVVESVDYDKSRVQVAVTIFGRSTPVELEFTQIEKAM